MSNADQIKIYDEEWNKIERGITLKDENWNVTWRWYIKQSTEENLSWMVENKRCLLESGVSWVELKEAKISDLLVYKKWTNNVFYLKTKSGNIYWLYNNHSFIEDRDTMINKSNLWENDLVFVDSRKQKYYSMNAENIQKVIKLWWIIEFEVDWIKWNTTEIEKIIGTDWKQFFWPWKDLSENDIKKVYAKNLEKSWFFKDRSFEATWEFIIKPSPMNPNLPFPPVN